MKIVITIFIVLEQSHLAAKVLLNRSFSHYDDLSYVFSRDHVTRGQAEIFTDVGSNVQMSTRNLSLTMAMYGIPYNV